MGKHLISAEVRAQIKLPSNNHLSVRALADKLAISKSVVQKYRSQAEKPVKKRRAGAPRKTTPGQCTAIKKASQRQHRSTRQLAEWSEQHGYGKISHVTAGKLLKSGRHPLAFTIVQRGRVLSVKNKTKRLAFARSVWVYAMLRGDAWWISEINWRVHKEHHS